MLHDTATIQANHERFIQRVAEAEEVWGLASGKGFAVCPSNEDEERTVLMFWSDRAYATRVKQAAFPEYEPAQITLFDFLFRWLTGMQQDRVLAGTNFNGDLAGLEIEAEDLKNELIDAIGPARALQYADRLKAELERQGRGGR
jgi:hypothetical protein